MEKETKKVQGRARIARRRNVGLSTNLFSVLRAPSTLYAHEVEVSPSLDNKELLERVVGTAIALLSASPYAFNGRRVLLTKPLEDAAEVRSGGRSYFVSFRLEGPVEFRRDTQAQNEVLASALRRAGLERIGRGYFRGDGGESVEFPEEGLVVKQGMRASIRSWPPAVGGAPSGDGLVFVVDTIAKVDHDRTALEVIDELLRNGLSERDISEHFNGRIVRTEYNGLTYRVEGVDFSRTPASTFRLDSGEEVSVGEYAESRYGVRVTRTGQPLLFKTGGDGKRLEFLPEFCRLTGLEERHLVNGKLMRAVAGAANASPTEKVSTLANFVSDPAVVEKLGEWGVTVDASSVRVQGNAISPLRVVAGDGAVEGKANWVQFANQRPIHDPRSPRSWAVVYEEGRSGVQRRDVDDFVRDLRDVAADAGCELGEPEILVVSDLRRFERRLGLVSDPLVVSITRDKQAYGAVKRALVGAKGVGVASQNVQQRTIKERRWRRRQAILRNLVRQIVSKLGGTPWVVEPNPIPSGTMVIGLDVTHSPVPGHPSVAGFCATLDDGGVQPYCVPGAPQERGREVVPRKQLAKLAGKALGLYEQRNGRMPKAIVVLRDGVGWSNLDRVRRDELKAIRDAIRAKGANVPVVFVVVHKREFVRLFAGAAGRPEVPPPGATVAGLCEVEGALSEFFSVTQSAVTGTPRPVHYVVVENELDLPVAKLQEIVHYLTHVHFNWAGIVKVPAPVTWAHSASLLAGQARLRAIHPKVATTFWFL
ncbi:MAG: hypothetical protein Kow0069_15130 [Promethearchaeota archaeon]